MYKTSAVLQLSRLAGGAVGSPSRPWTIFIQIFQNPHSMILQADQGRNVQATGQTAQGRTHAFLVHHFICARQSQLSK